MHDGEMHKRNLEELSVSFRLSKEVVDEITIRAIAEADLSEMEQIVFSLRHHLSDDAVDNTLVPIERISQEIYRDSGETLSSNRVMTLLERAEAKVNRFAWQTLENAVREHLGMDFAE